MLQDFESKLDVIIQLITCVHDHTSQLQNFPIKF